jgi:C1A family cysteine protease
MTNRTYGWKRDLPDRRDAIFAPSKAIQSLPPSVDLRPQCPPVYDQLALGSCTSNAVAAAIEFDQIKQGKTPFVPSRLFIYYNERVMEGTTGSDAGASIRDGIKSVNSQGVCPETEWPYDTSQFAVIPPAECYQQALLERALLYQRVPQDSYDVMECLSSGYPVVFGAMIFESFESNAVTQSGIVPMPEPGEQVLGGHALMIVGYDEAKQVFIVRNSWGDQWGMAGYCTIPFDYVLNPQLCSDFWTIQVVL